MKRQERVQMQMAIASRIVRYRGYRSKRRLEEKMNDKVKEVQDYLKKKGTAVTEDEIIDAAIKIATRWGGNWVFVCEFKQRGPIRNGKEKESDR